MPANSLSLRRAETAIESGLYAAVRVLEEAVGRARAEASPVLAPQDGPQRRFIEAREDVVIYGGQAGGGKTYGLLLAALLYISEPTYRGVIFRRTYAQVIKPGGLMDRAAEIYPAAGGVQRGAGFVFPGGAVIEFSHLKEERSKLDWQGADLGFIGFDELPHFTGSQFWYLLSRARATSPAIRPIIRATCNPDPDSFVADLLLGRWVDEATGDPIESESGRRYHFGRDGERMIFAKSPQDLIGVREPRSITFIRSTLDDNRILVARDPRYRANLEALPYVERMRLLHGNWKVRPTAGMVFSRGWFELIQDAPAGGRDVRYWDKAGTEGAGCMTAGVRMRRVGDTYYVIDVVRGQHGAQNRERLIRQVTELDGPDVVSWIELEPGSGGKESAENTIRSLAGFSVYADRVTGPKVARWSPFAAQAEAGNVKVLNRSWTQAFLEALHNADGEHPKNVDEVDAASGAFAKLALVREYAQITRRPWG